MQKPITFDQISGALSPEAETIAVALWATEQLPYSISFSLAQYTASAPNRRLSAEQFLALFVQDWILGKKPDSAQYVLDPAYRQTAPLEGLAQNA